MLPEENRLKQARPVCSLLSFVVAMPVALALAGCPEDDTAPPAPSATPQASTTPSAAPSATLEPADATNKPASANPAGIEPRIKAEVDGKDPDAGGGPTLAVTGSKATFTAPTGWKTNKSGNYTVATTADEKARFAAGGFAEGEDPATKLGDASAALGLTDCEWAAPESVSMGKDRLPATVADGKCKRGGASVKAAYATLAGTDLNVISMGAWDAGGDAAGMFSCFRSVKKGAGGGDATGIAACCAALRQNAVSAPPEQKGGYLAAAGACQAIINNPQGRAALAGVRALLAGASAPAACR